MLPCFVLNRSHRFNHVQYMCVALASTEIIQERTEYG